MVNITLEPRVNTLSAFCGIIQQLFEINNIHSEIDSFLFPESPFAVVYIPGKKLAIHCINTNYKNWHQTDPFLFSKMSDAALNKKIKLIHLWYDVWASDNYLVEKRLLAQVGVSAKIFARNTSVVSISKQQATQFFNANHLQKQANAAFYFGLMYKNELVAAASFSKPRKMTYEKLPYHSYELVRFASKAGTIITGGLSKLIKHFVSEKNVQHLMTYADRDWSTGSSYLKLGFRFEGNLPPQTFEINRVGLYRKYINNQQVIPLNGNEKINAPWKSGHTILKVSNAGSAKFILDLR